MRVLVWGLGPEYGHAPEPGDGYHGGESRERGLAAGLALLSHEVHLVSAWDGPTTTSGLWRRSVPDPLPSYDAVVVCGEAGLASVRQRPDVLRALDGHPAAAVHVDRPPAGDLGWARVVAASSRACFNRLDPAPLRVLVSWGHPEIPEGPSPFADRRPRAIFAGTAPPRFLDALRRLAEGDGPEVWFAGLLRPSEAHSWGGLRDPSDRARLLPGVRFLSDLVGESGFGAGPVRYRDVLRLLPHFDVGVNLAVAPEYVMTNCKVADYHAAGLPVASEAGGPDCVEVRAEGGAVVPHLDVLALGAAVAQLASDPGDRERRRDRARSRSWVASARALEGALTAVAGNVSR